MPVTLVCISLPLGLFKMSLKENLENLPDEIKLSLRAHGITTVKFSGTL